MSNLTEALFDFKDRIGPIGHLSNKLLVNMASQPDDHLTYQKPLSISTLRARLNFIQTGADDYFAENDIAPMDLKPLKNGGETLVFDCNNGYVLKARTGDSYKNHKWNKSLHAAHIGYSQELNVTYGIYPQVELTKPTFMQCLKMRAKALMSGYHLTDFNPYNFGLVNEKNKNKKSLRVIDDGAVQPIQTLHDVYHVAKEIMRPLYHAVPVIHGPWRAFRNSIKDMLGMELTDQQKRMRNMALDK